MGRGLSLRVTSVSKRVTFMVGGQLLGIASMTGGALWMGFWTWLVEEQKVVEGLTLMAFGCLTLILSSCSSILIPCDLVYPELWNHIPFLTPELSFTRSTKKLNK